jgi:anti-sigma factor RsiW
MTEEKELKLQAFFDGELPEKEAREIAAWLAADADATALLGELRNTRKALSDFEPAVKLPESREFYWSKIAREIRQLEHDKVPEPSVPWFVLLRRILVPAGAFAALAIAGILALHQFGPASGSGEVRTMLADAGAFTYRDQSEGVTVVWLSYPAENKFAPGASGDTLPQQ